MTQEEFRDAKELWRTEYAYSTFKGVKKGIESLLSQNIGQNSPDYYPLSVGLICLYCRPFTHNDLVGQISLRIVPKEYRDSHKRVLQFRNEIFAHSSGDATIGPDKYMNAVKVKKVHGKFALYITTSTAMPEFFKELKPLVEILTNETDRRRLELLAKFQPHIPHAQNGFFRLNIFNASGPPFIEIKENWPVS